MKGDDYSETANKIFLSDLSELRGCPEAVIKSFAGFKTTFILNFIFIPHCKDTIVFLKKKQVFDERIKIVDERIKIIDERTKIVDERKKITDERNNGID